MPSSLISVNLLYNKTNTFGLAEDVIVIQKILKTLQDSIHCQIGKARLTDMREPFVHSDLQFHLEIPIYSAIPWAHTNVLLVNSEHWSYNYDKYVNLFDALIFRDPVSANKFREELGKKGIRNEHIYTIPWSTTLESNDSKEIYGLGIDLGFVSFIAGSNSKFEYIKQIIPHWKVTDPSLTIYTTRNEFAEDLKKIASDNIIIKCQDLDVKTRKRLMALFRGHLVCSSGEAFGYAAANAEFFGAFTIMNKLPVFDYYYKDSVGVSWLSNIYKESETVRYSIAYPDENVIRSELENAFQLFKNSERNNILSLRQADSNKRFKYSCDAFLPLLEKLMVLIKQRRPSKGVFHCPPILHPSDCPPISIITPTYNRQNLIDIAFHNLLSTDYPLDKIEWIVIEDNEKAPHMASEKIISFQIQVPQIKLKYIPIEGRMTIGEKRNHAIEHATNDIILFMDDDDHYPTTSFRRRVAWLTKGTMCGKMGQATIACCTTIALYDLKKGLSAVNVPPFEVPLGQRISEATLTFYKSAWLERKFPPVSISEGEDWILGREDLVIEIPPQQIIVAFSHDLNKSSRRIPPSDQTPSCFWGFPKEYLIFIHGLVGVTIEDDTSTKSPKK